MTNRSEEYIQSLGEKLGFAVKPNENGTCLVTKGESTGVVVRANDDSGGFRGCRHAVPRPCAKPYGTVHVA